MEITKLYTEYQEHPIGLDEAVPRFSWELASEQTNVLQSAYRARVKRDEKDENGENAEKNALVWDSGKVASNRSLGIAYDGSALQACTRYHVHVQVWNQAGEEAEAEDWFETGLMNPDISAWEGAQWIAAPRYTVAARTRGVFGITSEFRLANGAKRAGIVFGEGDYRLLDGMLNEYGLAGENYIRYEVNIEDMSAPRLDIYRVGYVSEDEKDKPFASVLLQDAGTGELLMNEENREQFHTLCVKVMGNRAQAYFDGVLVDAGQQERQLVDVGRQEGQLMDTGWSEEQEPDENGARTLNPRGMNDVLTYPRLNRIGFFAGKEGKVYFRNYTVSNLRKPQGVFIEEKAGKSLYGKESIFKDILSVEQECFVIKDAQVTADPSNTSLPMFRREFQVKEGLKSARLYITSRGIYDCRINGLAVNNSLLAPGLTQYDRRLNYQTYDITDILRKGANGIGVILASGWWSDAQTYIVSNYNYFGDREAVLCKLVLAYEDGRRETLVSDPDHWQYYGQGPYEYGGFFLGEQYNGEKEPIAATFSMPGFDARAWERPIVCSPVPIAAVDAGFGRIWPAVNEKEPLLIGGYDAPVSVVEERTARERVKLREDVWVYDFGQEMAGVPEIVFHEKKGTKILIQYGEMLYPDLPAYAGNVGKLMRENYRDAESTDIYICKGDEEGETYRPRFTFHGFRYLQLVGVSAAPELSEVKALQYSSIEDFQGSFHSDHELLNRFAENVKWSHLCNFINIPTDCPQRNERMGWAGDTHVFCNTALHNANLKLFYEKNLTAMSDLQEDNGRYTEIAPIGGGFGGITYECASIFIAWEVYQQYGDVRTLECFYPGMKKYMDYMKDKGMPGKGDEEAAGPLADWLAFEETDAWLMWNAFYYREAVLMEKMARVIGCAEDAQEYALLHKRIRDFWNRTFVEQETGRTRTIDGELCDTQCSYALALAYGIADDAERMAGHLARKVRENGYRVGTGFFGTGLLNKALARNGYKKEAWKLLLQTEFPSWLYPVTQGATTIWEHWDSYTKERGFGEYNAMNSFNHYSLGSVLSWVYEDILGIQRQEEYPGYTHFLLKPDVGELESAYGSVASPFGKIESGFRKEKGKIRYSCRIPVNASATLTLPDGTERELGSGSYEFEMKDI